MDESFHFRLLRVSISQIIKASGYDKCKPSVINALTDLYIHSFQRLIQTARKCSETRTRSSSVLQVQDVMQALIFTGEIKPENYFKLDDDPMYENTQSYPVSAYNTRSLDSFIDWMGYSDIYRVSQQLNELPQSLIKNLIEKRKLDLDDSSTDHERRKRKYQEKQNYYNSMLHRAGAADGSAAGQDEPGDDDVDEITHRDKLRWLNYLIEKDMKLGQDLKYSNTSLINEFLMFQENKKFHPHIIQDEGESLDEGQDFRHRIRHLNDQDFVVLPVEEASAPEESVESVLTTKAMDKGIAPSLTPHPSTQLMDLLPYNIQYPESLTRDDLEQFILYREKLEMENEAVANTDPGNETGERPVADGGESSDKEEASDKIAIQGQDGENPVPEVKESDGENPVPEEKESDDEKGLSGEAIKEPVSDKPGQQNMSEESVKKPVESVPFISPEKPEVERHASESSEVEYSGKVDSNDASGVKISHDQPIHSSLSGEDKKVTLDTGNEHSQRSDDHESLAGKGENAQDHENAVAPNEGSGGGTSPSRSAGSEDEITEA